MYYLYTPVARSVLTRVFLDTRPRGALKCVKIGLSCRFLPCLNRSVTGYILTLRDLGLNANIITATSNAVIRFKSDTRNPNMSLLSARAIANR